MHLPTDTHPTGWLSTYLSRYLHQDPSIRNALITTKPVKGKVFEVPEQFLEHVSSIKDKELVGEI